MNAVIIIVMKHAGKISFIIRDKRLPRHPDPARDRWVLGDGRARQPTPEEIADFAIGLAMEDAEFAEHAGMGSKIRELFHWPAWATPCQDHRQPLLPFVEKFKKKAEEELRRHYQYYHALELRQTRWRRAHPRPRGWAWTRKPLKHAVPPPRRRLFRPPELAYPDRGAPPPPPSPDGSPQRPGWRERERLLWYDLALWQLNSNL